VIVGNVEVEAQERSLLKSQGQGVVDEKTLAVGERVEQVSLQLEEEEHGIGTLNNQGHSSLNLQTYQMAMVNKHKCAEICTISSCLVTQPITLNTL
jgi:hypothetical protein